MSDIARETFTIQIERRKRLPLSDGSPGFTTVHDGWEEHQVTVEVDMKALALTLGERAVRSKGGKAVEASGNVIVRRVTP